jgi:hypothetical protein
MKRGALGLGLLVFVLAAVHALVFTHFIPPLPMSTLEGALLGAARQPSQGGIRLAQQSKKPTTGYTDCADYTDVQCSESAQAT